MKRFNTLIKTRLVEPENEKGEALLSRGDIIASSFTHKATIQNGKVAIELDEPSKWLLVSAMIGNIRFIPDVEYSDSEMTVDFSTNTQFDGQEAEIVISLKDFNGIS